MRLKNLGEFKCLKCGWLHAGIPETDAITAVTDFNAYFSTLGLEAQASFGEQPSSLEMHKRCYTCGAPAASFLPATPGDAPLGCTLQVVMAPNMPRKVGKGD